MSADWFSNQDPRGWRVGLAKPSDEHKKQGAFKDIVHQTKDGHAVLVRCTPALAREIIRGLQDALADHAMDETVTQVTEKKDEPGA